MRNTRRQNRQMRKFSHKFAYRWIKMSISKRQEQILELLGSNGFLSVSKIADLTFTSESSIRRDLRALANQSLITRTHGGASANSDPHRPIPLINRMTRNISAKKKIAKKASAFLRDGMSVMLDGSSTAGFLVPYIAKHTGITLFTNNMNTAISAIGYGIETVCLGGRAVNNSAVLSGVEAYEALSNIHTDILFFSSKALSHDGVIWDCDREEVCLRRSILQNTDECVFLCASEKFPLQAGFRQCSLEDVDCMITEVEDTAFFAPLGPLVSKIV